MGINFHFFINFFFNFIHKPNYFLKVNLHFKLFIVSAKEVVNFI